MKRMLIATLLCGASLSAQADSTRVKQGEYLARAGDCVACHTAKGGKPFAGGLPMETPIGTVYSTNITPDASGIGNYSFEDFDQAVRHGVGKDGSTLYPASRIPRMHASAMTTCVRCMPTSCRASSRWRSRTRRRTSPGR